MGSKRVGPFTARVCQCQGSAAAMPACSRIRDPLHVRIVHFRVPSMRALFLVIDLALDIYIWLLIAAAILSWLVAFNVVNTRNQVVGMIGDFLYRITEPALRPIRNVMPDLGGIDISPVILILIIIFIRYVIALYILPNVY
jgi:YggT family protein